jgi:thymidylate kinase
VIEGYRARALADPTRFARIDALQPPPRVAAQIDEVLRGRGW